MKEVLLNNMLKESQRPKTDINQNRTEFFQVRFSVFGYTEIVI